MGRTVRPWIRFGDQVPCAEQSETEARSNSASWRYREQAAAQNNLRELEADLATAQNSTQKKVLQQKLDEQTKQLGALQNQASQTAQQLAAHKGDPVVSEKSIALSWAVLKRSAQCVSLPKTQSDFQRNFR